MYRQCTFHVLAPMSVVWGASGAPVEGFYRKQRREPKAKTGEGLSTGYVEREDGRYAPVDDRILAPIANPGWDGFHTEGLDKHLRKRLRVRVTINSSGAWPLVKVPSIETVGPAGGGQTLSKVKTTLEERDFYGN